MTYHYDHYAVVNELANKMDSDGHTEWATKIRNILASGSTGTEIFMGLRWQLQQYKNAETSLSQEFREKIDELIKKLNESLA